MITIEAATNTGAFYATRTLLQMGETDLQNGEIRDSQVSVTVALCWIQVVNLSLMTPS